MIVDLRTLPFATQNLQTLASSQLVASVLDNLCQPGSFCTFNFGEWLEANLAALQQECPIKLPSKSVYLERAWATNLCFMLFWRHASEPTVDEQQLRRPNTPFRPVRSFAPCASRHNEMTTFYTASAAWLLAVESGDNPSLCGAMHNCVKAAARTLSVKIDTSCVLTPGVSPLFVQDVQVQTNEQRWLLNIKTAGTWCFSGL